MSTTEINSHYGKNIKWIVYRNGYNAFVGNLTLDGAAYDISSRTFTAYIRTPEGNADKLTLTEGNGITNGGAEGTLTIALTEAQLATLPRDRYFIVVEYTIGGKDYPLCQGYIEITDRTNPGMTTTSVTIPVDINGVTVNMAVTLAGGGGGEVTAESIAEALTYTPANAAGLANHIADAANPHQVTKAQLGLSAVDNTADADKPLSTAQQEALAAKQDTIAYTSTPPEIVSAYIQGQTMAGKVLSLDYTFRDVDGTTEGATTFQWMRADDDSGTNATEILGATARTYSQATTDSAKYIACKITPVNASGEAGSVFTTNYVGAVDAVFYPLDEFTNVIVAFAFKKLSASYAGNCLRVQATSGGPTLDVGFDANGDLNWGAIQTFNAGNPVYLSIFYDQSGNGNNMTFASFGVQPLLDFSNRRIVFAPDDNGVITDNPTLDLDTSDFSVFFDYTSLQALDTVFTYFQKNTNFSTANFQFQSSGAQSIMYTGAGTANDHTYNIPTDKDQIICSYRSPTQKSMRYGDTTVNDAEVATDLTSTGNMRFNSGDNSGGDWYFRAFILVKQDYGADYLKVKKFLS